MLSNWFVFFLNNHIHTAIVTGFLIAGSLDTKILGMYSLFTGTLMLKEKPAKTMGFDKNW